MNQSSVNPFKKASKSQSRLRLGLVGVSGSGKTFSALAIGSALAAHYDGRVALIDTEHGSASKYADRFSFDVLELVDFNPKNYIDAIKAASDYYDVLIIDSLSHAWSGSGGVLEMVDNAAKRSQSNNSFTAWRDVTPLHNQLVEAIVGAPIHLIATMRSKTEYVLEKDDRGKTTPRKVGMAPVQRDGLEYEFDLVGDMDTNNTLIVSKSRIPALSGKVIAKPGAELGDTLFSWLTDGKPLHWVLNGGGARFSERMKALNLPPDYVLAFLEPDRAIERLSETELDEAAALARLDELAAQRQDVPTPPPASPAADPDLSGASASGEASHDPIANYGQELGTTVITATRPDEQTADEDYKAYACHKVLIQTKGKRRDFIFKSDDGHKFTVPEAKVNNLKTEVIMWSPGKPHDLPVTVWVEARPDGDDWDVRSVSDEVQP